MSSSPSSQLIQAYLDGPVQLRRVVSDLSPQELKERPVPGRWSTLEVVCHLVDSEQVWCHRMKRVIAEERPLVIGYDQTRFHGQRSRMTNMISRKSWRLARNHALADGPNSQAACGTGKRLVTHLRAQRAWLDDTQTDARSRGRSHTSSHLPYRRETASAGVGRQLVNTAK